MPFTTAAHDTSVENDHGAALQKERARDAAPGEDNAGVAALGTIEGFMESLPPVARSVGVAVIVVEPAAVSSDFVANAALDIEGLLARSGVYRSALSLSLKRTMRQFDQGVTQSPDDVAAVVVATLDSTAPAFRVQTSAGAAALIGMKLLDVDGSRVTGVTSSWVTS